MHIEGSKLLSWTMSFNISYFSFQIFISIFIYYAIMPMMLPHIRMGCLPYFYFHRLIQYVDGSIKMDKFNLICFIISFIEASPALFSVISSLMGFFVHALHTQIKGRVLFVGFPMHDSLCTWVTLQGSICMNPRALICIIVFSSHIQASSLTILYNFENN